MVYRPAGLYAGSSTATAVVSPVSTTSTTTEKSKLEANETVISIQTEHPPDSLNATSIDISNVAEGNGTRYTENDILPWLMQSAANPPYKRSKTTHQYQVTEDSEADG